MQIRKTYDVIKWTQHEDNTNGECLYNHSVSETGLSPRFSSPKLLIKLRYAGVTIFGVLVSARAVS